MSSSLGTQGHSQLIPDSNVVGSLISLAVTIVAETDPLLQYWFPVGDALALACIATWMSSGIKKVNISLLFETAIANSKSCLAILDARLIEGAGFGEQGLASSKKPMIADIAIFPYMLP
ncbi:hypothetical protein FRACYDRAFT_236866 [Fragilariopsis cylindrus CCMP1102]|uniref:Uncharacterized protein n=1 Tax=Fragilariopsis cylindrus CCMP1102 TaxID=635003 RepID=A0A1E7FK80_9STRA|nr:hypothetical protein FRACYDRAFT_236866 [Fragilariopsis cylindrus CCMP1102]|eukprot:OEU18589.1 hypothetical protein FRACYDRAFT_236866 [Fragilariopsis cylindrus CCMP1102]